MNLESFRQRCIKRIRDTYNNLLNIDKIISEEERNVLVEIQVDDSISNKDDAFNFARQRLSEKKGMMVSRITEVLRREIRICAKELSRLATDKEIYEYYKLVSEMPSNQEYNRYLNMSLSEFESNVFREYIMSEPRLENIIISYSELEARNIDNSSNNSNNNNNIDNNNNNSIDNNNDNNNNNNIDNNIDNNNDNNNNIDNNNSNDNNNDDNNEVDETEENTDDLTEKEEELKNSCVAVINSLSRNREVPENFIKELETLYIELLEKGLSEDTKDLYNKMIKKHNIYIHRLNQNESVLSREGRFGIIDGITEILGKGISLIRGTKAYKTRCLKKINKAKEENDAKKRSKYVKLLTDQDIVCNLTRMRRENTIESLNYKLVRDNALSERRTKRLYKTAQKQANSLERQLDRKIQRENEIFENGSRAITVLNQYLEVISYANDYNQKVIDFEKFLNQLRMKNFLDETLYNIYHAEAENIANYRDSMNGSVYFLDLNDIVDLTNYYQDSEKVEKNIPFIKRRHI